MLVSGDKTLQIDNIFRDGNISLEKIAKLKKRTSYIKWLLENFHFKTMKDTKEMFVYKNGVYVPEGEVFLEEKLQQMNEFANNNFVREISSAIKRKTYVDRKDFDKYDHLINLKNGIFNLKTESFEKHNPKYLMRVQFPVDYIPKTVPRKFIKFLKECLPDSKNLTTVLEELGSIFTDLRLEKIYLHVGTGSNGKSTFFVVLNRLCGIENTTHNTINNLINTRFSMASLDGKVANICTEILDDEIKHLGLVKGLVSGDPMTVEKKGKDSYSMVNHARLFFSCNRLPKISKFGYAEFRRFVITKWTQKFEVEPQEKNTKEANINLVEDLTNSEELSGILNLALFYAGRLWKKKKLTYEQSTEQIEMEWQQRINPLEKFVNTSLEFELSKKIPKKILFEKYEEWCISNKIVSVGFREFNSFIKEIQNIKSGTDKIDGKAAVTWHGIGIK